VKVAPGRDWVHCEEMGERHNTLCQVTMAHFEEKHSYPTFRIVVKKLGRGVNSVASSCVVKVRLDLSTC
jgi:hypothetical protein